MTETEYKEIYARSREAIEQKLDSYLPAGRNRTTDAMRYSLLGGGKRLRGVILTAVCGMLAPEKSGDALTAACAIEMLHCYSLIHDDLPCMDDDPVRRGKPSCHIAFGETVATLAGDALLTKAFEVLTGISDPGAVCRCVRILSECAGSEGMVYGQEMDLTIPESERDCETLDRINACKTGRLLTAPALMGAACAGVQDPAVLEHLTAYSVAVGKAFQIVDDILDVTATTEELGKPAGSDSRNGKATYASLLSVEGAYERAAELTALALRELDALSCDVSFLRAMTENLLKRKN